MAAKTYIVSPINTGEKPYEITAERYEFDQHSGWHQFFNGTGEKAETVATALNVMVRPK